MKDADSLVRETYLAWHAREDALGHIGYMEFDEDSLFAELAHMLEVDRRERR